LAKARQQGDELQAQLIQATDQLKSSQDRISQLEAQLKQSSSSADLDKARQQGDELHSQLGQATERLKSSQDRISQLEAQLTSAVNDDQANTLKRAKYLPSMGSSPDSESVPDNPVTLPPAPTTRANIERQLAVVASPNLEFETRADYGAPTRAAARRPRRAARQGRRQAGGGPRRRPATAARLHRNTDARLARPQNERGRTR
jgi:exonuclease VII large subunit